MLHVELYQTSITHDSQLDTVYKFKILIKILCIILPLLIIIKNIIQLSRHKCTRAYIYACLYTETFRKLIKLGVNVADQDEQVVKTFSYFSYN